MSINYETLEGQAEALSGVVKMLHYMITEKDGGNYNPAKLDDESADLVNVFKGTFYRKGRKAKAETVDAQGFPLIPELSHRCFGL